MQHPTDHGATLGDVGELLIVGAAGPELVLATVGLMVDVLKAVLVQMHQAG